MAFGIDTRNYLNQIDWAELAIWKREYPRFAGRYFGGAPASDPPTWVVPEFTDAKRDTFGALTHVFPLRVPNADLQQTPGLPGYSLGADAGHDTCQRIVNAINAGQLQLPPSGIVHVWLDVEPGTALTPDYWAGFCSSVRSFIYINLQPFRAAIYCYYQETGGRWLPELSVRQALDSVNSRYPAHYTLCHGLWSSEPQPCANCRPEHIANWSVFGQYSQPYDGTNRPVLLYLYQYAQYGNPQLERGGCRYTCGDRTFAGGQVVDLDSTSTTGAENYALVIR
jgi:hypothetical protein